MLTRDLYNSVLIQPKKSEANKLYIVSGYASATFARRHLLNLLEIDEDIEVNLIIGMPGRKSDHLAFLQLHNEFSGKFKGYYLNSSPPVHSKVYSWFIDEDPLDAFSGSANYSQYGFFETQQINQISVENPQEIKFFYEELLTRCTYIPDHQIVLPIGHSDFHIAGSIPAGTIRWEIPDKRVTISFLKSNGTLPQVSGLNWGQRQTKYTSKVTGQIKYSQREPNQAYLGLRLTARNDGFLPPIAFTFTLITDDGQNFDCVIAQMGRKSIESTNNNSELGIYFRERLGVPLGSPVRIEDLERYGRTDYTIEKIDEETFLLDFSVAQ